MTVDLRYGVGTMLHLTLPSTSILANYAQPNGSPLSDPEAAVRAAILSPIEFPPLAVAIVPGDNVVLAVDSGVPCAPVIVRGIVESLRDSSPEIGSIGVLVAAGETATLSAIQSAVGSDVEVREHNAQDRGGLSYLAASKEGKPIYLSQLLCDADVVIPIGVVRLDESLDYFGVYSGLFPTFSDEDTQRRFDSPSTHDWTAQQRRRREEVTESAWMLGAQLVVQVVPGSEDSVNAILCGEGQTVHEEGQRQCALAWRHRPLERADLVIASIAGPQQSWRNFGRALYSASQAVVEGGAILLCTSIRENPGAGLRRIIHAASDDIALQEIRRERSDDATAAAILAETKQLARIYLLSQLERETVEDMGIGHVAGAEDIERLASQVGSCIVVGDAHHAVTLTECSPSAM